MKNARTVADARTANRPPAPPPRRSSPRRTQAASELARAPISRRSVAEVDLADVVAFVRVVDAGSFTRAAEQSSLPKSALSRRVSRLEGSLGVRLLQRTTRSLSLTDAGAAYHARVSAALGQLNEAKDIASEATQDPAGVVRITAPVDIGAGPLTSSLAKFARLYPKIHVEVDATPRLVDLVGEGFDLAVRAGKLRDSSLVARKLGDSPLLLVATAAYLKERGAPKKLSDLERLDCILLRATKGEATWKLEGPRGEESVRVRGPLSGTDFSFVRAAALRGAGVALIPLPAAIEDLHAGHLEWVLPNYMGAKSPIHLVYPSARFVPHRVAVLRDFLAEHLRFDCPSATMNARVEAARAR